MANLFLPDIARVVDIGKSVVFGDLEAISSLKKASVLALEFVENFENIFLNLSLSFYRNDEVDEIINFTKQDIGQLKKVLKEIEPVLDKEKFIELNPILYSLEKYSMRIANSMDRLSSFKEIDDYESPIPVVNRVIKLSYNVAEGRVGKEELIVFFPVIASFVSYIELDISRFAAIYKNEKDIISAGKKLVSDLQRAAGALSVYIKEDEPTALVDSIRIFKFASSALYLLLKKMDGITSGASEVSKLTPVSEFVKAYTAFKDGKADKNVVLTALNALDRLVIFYNETVSSIKKSHYFYFIEPLYNADTQLASAFVAYWKKVFEKAKKLSEDIDTNELVSKFETRAKELEKIVEAHENEIRKVSQAPFIEEIKELTGRYLSGALVPEYYSSRLEAFSQNHRVLTDEFKSKSVSSELAKEVRQLLDMQREGIDEMLLFLEDSGKEHLVSGMKSLESPIPRLFEIYKGSSPVIKKVEFCCPSCSKPYKKGDKICNSCSTNLPVFISEDVSGEEDTVKPLPSKLETIVKALKDFDSGAIVKDELVSAVSAYKKTLTLVYSSYGSATKKFAQSKSAEVRDCAEAFSQNLDLLFDSIDGLLEAIENGGDVDAPFSQMHFAGRSLEELREILRESKRAIK